MRSLIITLLLFASLKAQILLPTLESPSVPEFGLSIGDWGQWGINRPYGLNAYTISSFKDLMLLDPIQGQPMNLHRQWRPHETTGQGLWDLHYGAVAVPGDSTLPTLWASARQGYQELRALNVWVHKALSENLTLGIQSEKRSQNRFYLDDYDHQLHQLEFIHSYENASVTAGVEFEEVDIPLFLYVPDSTGVLTLDLDRHVAHELGGGYFDLKLSDPILSLQEVFWQMRTGKRLYEQVQQQEWSRLFLVSGETNPFGSTHLRWSYGDLMQRLDSLSRRTPMLRIEARINPVDWIKVNGGIVALNGLSAVGDLELNRDAWVLSLSRKVALHDPGQLADIQVGSLSLATFGLKHENASIHISGWTGSYGSEPPFFRVDPQVTPASVVSGYRMQSALDLKSGTGLNLGYQQLLKIPDTFVWDERRITWGINQRLRLFKSSMEVDAVLWGSHHNGLADGYFIETRQRIIDAGTGRSAEWVHRVNYSLTVQVRTVTFAFTDVNMFQDPLWSDLFNDPDLRVNYRPVLNLLPENRFQYFTLIWEFQN